MNKVSFYHKGTGIFRDYQFMTSKDELIALNTPPDHAAIEGHFDHLSQKVDVESGEVVDHQPPAPSADHEWDAAMKRWRKHAATAARDVDRAIARARLTHLETMQPRLLREVALGYEHARKQLAEIDEEIIALRPQLAPPPS